MSYLSESGGSGLRDGQDRKRKVEYVGVGFPNPLGEENSPTMDTAPQIVTHLAPEGRHVYSTRHTPNTLKPQRGDR